jgi:hypothetical protein
MPVVLRNIVIRKLVGELNGDDRDTSVDEGQRL